MLLAKYLMVKLYQRTYAKMLQCNGGTYIFMLKKGNMTLLLSFENQYVIINMNDNFINKLITNLLYTYAIKRLKMLQFLVL